MNYPGATAEVQSVHREQLLLDNAVDYHTGDAAGSRYRHGRDNPGSHNHIPAHAFHNQVFQSADRVELRHEYRASLQGCWNRHHDKRELLGHAVEHVFENLASYPVHHLLMVVRLLQQPELMSSFPMIYPGWHLPLSTTSYCIS